MPGYSGINCTSVCPHPTYGHNCQGSCDCDEDMCDASTGCPQKTTGRNMVCRAYEYVNLKKKPFILKKNGLD